MTTESNEEKPTSEEDERVTEEDAIVQTPHGERYKAHLINLTGHPIDDE